MEYYYAILLREKRIKNKKVNVQKLLKYAQKEHLERDPLCVCSGCLCTFSLYVLLGRIHVNMF